MKLLKTKMNIAEIKAKAKKHAPAIVAVATTVTTVIATGLAAYYRNELMKAWTVDPNAWPVIEIPPTAMKDVRENGTTLKYREAKYGDKKFLSQSTTMDDFGQRLDEEFDRFKETGKYEDE